MFSSLSLKSMFFLLCANLGASIITSALYVSYSLAAPLAAEHAHKEKPAEQTIEKQTQLLMDYYFAAARTGDVEVLTHFIEAGFPVDQRNGQSYTALMVSAYNGQELATAALLEQGANACLQDKRGNTAIMGAVIKAEFSIMKQLYSQECDTEMTNKSGMSLEDFATFWGQSDKLRDAASVSN
ncbi:ankyrin repeat domain-containing protein [Shewanella sp. Choline-02u-19]|uniref:ankyrin repeat domain-containing protein n=1 Tax=unclassified Shewanella TaxID=196818 RepID=UPI000C31D10A|nr:MULTISPECIES: ankyrin repeat domain-containing protein [unclassified Shewanella]PKH55642.1 ankyrin repeat domain-containing protein [Shewanella sp. Bg11-22]PKI29884.1 ankyrin repeat domain-containing protein [Shewanella sp. Choline-02u-19]